MKIFITGVAGFIGSTLAIRLLARGDQVIGIDNMNDYYDVSLKEARLARFIDHPNFHFVRGDIADRAVIMNTFIDAGGFDALVNLAAQAGVRYSLENPYAYVDANLVGFVNLLEAARHHGCGHFVFASSSSVYGANTKQPFSEHDNIDHPVSLYAATKKSNELMAHAYSHLFGLHCTGLRFFTVYGPWGRPDMALFKFTKGILAGTPIDVYNNGDMVRDFTYIDDIVEGVVRTIDTPPQPNPAWNAAAPDSASSYTTWRVFNIGNGRPVKLLRYIALIEQTLGAKAVINFMPMQPGDVPATMADTSELAQVTGYQPTTGVDDGVPQFVEWYRRYYQV